MKAPLALVLMLALAPGATSAGEYNEVLSPGDRAPSWQGLVGVDGKKHALDDFKDKDVVIVVFTCCSCPVAVEYEDRIITLARKHAGPKVAIVAINPNRIPEDRLPEMKERARQKGFPFPFLHDETQKTARAYGAVYTPEFFVLNRDRKVVYMGAMDDKIDPRKVTKHYLEAAVSAARKGEQPAVRETLAHGCQIRYERQRRKGAK